MAIRKSNVKLIVKPVLIATRKALREERLVYVLAVNKSVKYKNGRSRIFYIGTTRKGIKRISASVAYRAKKAFQRRGIKRIAAFVLTCQPRKGTQMWRNLERAALLAFKKKYGKVPSLNAHGKNFKNEDVFQFFTHSALLKQFARIEATEI